MSAELPWTIARLLQWTTDYLRDRGADSPRLDAEVLLSAALECERIDLYTAFQNEPSDDQRGRFRELVQRRAGGEPVAYLVEKREFYSLPFEVNKNVLIPRPETEFLVAALLDACRRRTTPLPDLEEELAVTAANETSLDESTSPEEAVATASETRPIHIADVGTGSGIIAVCAAKYCPESLVTAIDISPMALAVARRNAERNSVDGRIEFIESDLFANIPKEKKFDFIASNPPYIGEKEMPGLAREVRDYEPLIALTAGNDGLEIIDRLLVEAAERLLPEGELFIELSPIIHDRVLARIQSDENFQQPETIVDLARLPRIVTTQLR